MTERIVIRLDKPGPVDRSRAIGQAMDEFWNRGIAKKALLGEVNETDTEYDVEILYEIL